jgi:glucosylceramidase
MKIIKMGWRKYAEYNDTWALYFQNILMLIEEGIDIWGLTVENEPLGNGNNWEKHAFRLKK